jgi:hypothetical protein
MLPNRTITVGMEDLALIETSPTGESGLAAVRSIERRPAMVLCSRVPGRDRWYVDALEDSPRLAAAVQLVLRSEEGVSHAFANPFNRSGAGALSPRFAFRTYRSVDPARSRVRSHEDGVSAALVWTSGQEHWMLRPFPSRCWDIYS